MTIELKSLAHRYGQIHALRGVSAVASAGKITAVLGPNAAGKSTLLRCIIGVIRPTSGAALIDGEPAHTLGSHKLARRIAYVPQRSTVAAAFSVQEIVELGRYILPKNSQRISHAMHRLAVAELANRPYDSLSVGQQQRVTLARALAQLEIPDAGGPSPHLVLDEPMSAMDLRHIQDITRLLRELAEQGVSVLIAMHDLTLAASLADDVWLLSDGQLVAGPACDVLTAQRLEQVYGVGFEWVQGRLLTAVTNSLQSSDAS